MNTTAHHQGVSGIVRGIVGTAAVLALTAAIAPAGTATANTADDHQRDVCRSSAQYLPRTPDAVEGWLRHCSR